MPRLPCCKASSPARGASSGANAISRMCPILARAPRCCTRSCPTFRPSRRRPRAILPTLPCSRHAPAACGASKRKSSTTRRCISARSTGWSARSRARRPNGCWKRSLPRPRRTAFSGSRAPCPPSGAASGRRTACSARPALCRRRRKRRLVFYYPPRAGRGHRPAHGTPARRA